MTNQSTPSALTSESFHRFNNSVDPDIADKLGNHAYQVDGNRFTRFTVWAPGAKSVYLVGDFNHWDSTTTPLTYDSKTGVWTRVVKGINPGERYQYAITDTEGTGRNKSDPYATQFAPLPDHCSLVGKPHQHHWKDTEWTRQRKLKDWSKEPISIYELHLGSWRRTADTEPSRLTYRSLASPLVDYLKRLNFSHVLFMPLMEHPYDGSWGYQVTGFFAPTSRFGTPQDLAYLVDTLHQHGIGVLFDWVPAHFPKDDFGLSKFDGGPLYEYACPKQGHHPEWGTAIFDYNKPQVVSFLVSSALTWLREFHFDGIRVDAVASMLYRDYSRASGDWTPNVEGGIENIEAIQFIKTLNQEIGSKFPGALRIAEESTAWPGVTRPIELGGLGFDLKWNLGWMNDTLTYFRHSTSERHSHRHTLTLPSCYQQTENFCLPLSHDEVVHEKSSLLAKMPGATLTEKARHLRALFVWMWAWPGKKLLFMGGELGQIEEWNHDSQVPWALESVPLHKGIQDLIAELNQSYLKHPILATTDDRADSFLWLPFDGENDSTENVFAFARLDCTEKPSLICIGNFSSTEHQAFRLSVPHAEDWKVSLCSSSHRFQETNTSVASREADLIVSDQSHGNQLTIHLPAETTLLLSPQTSPSIKQESISRFPLPA